MNLRDVVSRWAAFVTELCEDKYGHAPPIKVLYCDSEAIQTKEIKVRNSLAKMVTK